MDVLEVHHLKDVSTSWKGAYLTTWLHFCCLQYGSDVVSPLHGLATEGDKPLRSTSVPVDDGGLEHSASSENELECLL